MRAWKFGALMTVSALALAACGSGKKATTGDGGGGAGGDVGGAGGTVVTTTTTTAVGGDGGGGAGGAACGILYDPRPDCEACMEDACCDDLQKCAPGTDCDALLVCVQACGMNDPCVDGCLDDHAQGLADLQTLNTCYADNCKTQEVCQFPICDSMLLFSDEACAECLGTGACCTALTDCAADADCGACLSDPMGAGCDTYAPFLAAQSCQNDGDKCGKQCTFGICDTNLGYPNNSECNFCLGQADMSGGCCETTKACTENTLCLECLTGDKPSTGAECMGNAEFTAFTTCRAGKCNTECGG